MRTLERLDQRFLRYIIGSSAFTQHVLGIQTGTAVPHISSSQIKEFKFVRPPLEEQKAIAHILSSLDDKIELNQQMNRTLEGIARALFKSWFIDFDPVRAKLDGR
ncbi:MAG: restriction endonuclease subunit S [Elainella sp. Prado103]|jgi:type I restriction enzyme S subunit|nr:restriction endonuclease subunit S [Elainella sp. Prado103]